MPAILIALLMSLAALANSPPAAAQAPAASERLNLLAARDIAASETTVRIEVPREKGRVLALRIAVPAGEATAVRAIVLYGNGQVHVEDRGRPQRLAPARRAPDIDRREEARFVEAVEVTLEASRTATRIEIWGQQGPDSVTYDSRPRTRSPTFGGEATRSAQSACRPEVCAEVVVLYGTDRDRQPLSAGGGKRIQFGTRTSPEMTLGQSVVSIPTRGRAAKGVWSRPEIDLIIWRIPRPEDRARDFTLVSVEQKDAAGFLAAARAELARKGNRAFVFVHGYNVGFDDAMFRTAQIAHDTEFQGAAFAYSWPARGGILDYVSDFKAALDAHGHLREFLELVATRTGATEIHLVSHSMGTNTLLGALKAIAAGPSRNLRFGEIVIAAPDVLRRHYDSAAGALKVLARGVTMYVSDNDRALQLSVRANSGETPIGLIPSGRPPTVTADVEAIDVSRLGTGFFAFNHSTFAEREVLVVDMGALLAGRRRPPHERNVRFVMLSPTQPAGARFWRYEQR